MVRRFLEGRWLPVVWALPARCVIEIDADDWHAPDQESVDLADQPIEDGGKLGEAGDRVL
jgi:hypothetical protein